MKLLGPFITPLLATPIWTGEVRRRRSQNIRLLVLSIPCMVGLGLVIRHWKLPGLTSAGSCAVPSLSSEKVKTLWMWGIATMLPTWFRWLIHWFLRHLTMIFQLYRTNGKMVVNCELGYRTKW
jgi:hypothetical protein